MNLETGDIFSSIKYYRLGQMKLKISEQVTKFNLRVIIYIFFSQVKAPSVVV